MKQKTINTTNEIKNIAMDIAVILLFIILVGSVEAIADTCADIMSQIVP